MRGETVMRGYWNDPEASARTLHGGWGEEVVAFVVVRPGTTASARTLDAQCLAHLARFKRPRQYFFVEALPKNAYGKTLKTELRAQAAACRPSHAGR